jgi:hypothetical protein
MGYYGGEDFQSGGLNSALGTGSGPIFGFCAERRERSQSYPSALGVRGGRYGCPDMRQRRCTTARAATMARRWGAGLGNSRDE